MYIMNIHFVYGSFNPTTAVGNRTLAYMRGISKMSVSATFYFLLPDKYYSTVAEEYPNIAIEYMWKKWHINNKLFKYIPYLINIFRLRNKLNAGDSVYMYDLNDVPKFLFGKKGIKLFYEKTEHPLVSNYGSLLRRMTLEKHIEDCRKYTGMFVISAALKKYYISQGIDSSKIHVINIIVDADRFNNVRMINKKRQIVYCGNANNNKDGVDQLIKSFAELKKTHGDIQLTIIGPKPNESHVDNNMSLVKKLGIENDVNFLGVVSPSMIPNCLSSALIVALDRPNSIQATYGFPTKLGEYLLSGTPAVVTRVGDIPLFLEHKVSVVFAEPNDIASFSSCLEWVLDHPEESAMIGERGKQVAERSFNYEIETRKLVEAMMA